MPSNTSKPTRYGVSAGPGKATRSPSTRRRTALRRLGCNGSSQVPRLGGGPDRPATARASVEVAWL